MKLDELIWFELFFELKELGDWLSILMYMWLCYLIMYKYNREEFEKKFLEIMKLIVDYVLIFIGGVGFNFMLLGWRNFL